MGDIEESRKSWLDRRKALRRRRAGFIYIVGWRVLSTRERIPEIKCDCPGCGVDGARFISRIRRAWFTMFFIPIVPLDPIDRAERISQCRACGKLFDVPFEQMARRARGGRGDFASAIQLYNQLRESPADGALLLELMQMYQEIGEPAEAESAARHFPLAMQAEPRCGALLAELGAR